MADCKGWGSVYIKADDFRLKYCIEGGFSKITSTKEGLHRLCRQNGTSSSGGRKPISGNQSKKRDGTPFKNLGVEITFPTPLVFPNCFHITLFQSKFPFIFRGNYYIPIINLLKHYCCNFNKLDFLSCKVRDQEVGSSNLLSPTTCFGRISSSCVNIGFILNLENLTISYQFLTIFPTETV